MGEIGDPAKCSGFEGENGFHGLGCRVCICRVCLVYGLYSL